MTAHKVGTFNGRLGQALREVPALLDEYDLDWLALQEVGGRKRVKALRRMLKGHGYRVYATAGGDTAIVVRRGLADFPLLHWMGGIGWERKPGRPGLHPPREGLSVRVGGREGYRVASVHLPPKAAPGQPLRVEARYAVVARLAVVSARWRRRGRAYVLAGDWNVEAGHPLLAPLVGHDEGFGVDRFLVHGVAVTDYRPVASRLSDHRPRIATVHY